MDFYKAYDLLDNVRERLEATISNSSVDLMPSDTDDFFITVTQRNQITGNESKWSFCVDFGTNKVQMLEPVEDEESFGNVSEIFGIIKNFLNGGSSREKRFGNKIGSVRVIKSAKTICKKGSAKLIEHCEAGDYGYLGRYTIIINGEEVFHFTAENR